jgi:hypothetical protein
MFLLCLPRPLRVIVAFFPGLAFLAMFLMAPKTAPIFHDPIGFGMYVLLIVASLGAAWCVADFSYND